jgi:ketosteroid isomerase-like protein
MTLPTTPAGRLAKAFGDLVLLRALYADDVSWQLPASTGASLQRVFRGKDAVLAFNADVWGKYYRPDCSVEILTEVGDEKGSAVRFTYRAFSLIANKPYENEYQLFVESGSNGVTRIYESFDTLTSAMLYK